MCWDVEQVYCVQQIALLGYDVLFQDVDIVWYKHPFEYFHDSSSPVYNHDMYFQVSEVPVPVVLLTRVCFIVANEKIRSAALKFVRMTVHEDCSMHPTVPTLACIMSGITTKRGTFSIVSSWVGT